MTSTKRELSIIKLYRPSGFSKTTWTTLSSSLILTSSTLPPPLRELSKWFQKMSSLNRKSSSTVTSTVLHASFSSSVGTLSHHMTAVLLSDFPLMRQWLSSNRCAIFGDWIMSGYFSTPPPTPNPTPQALWRLNVLQVWVSDRHDTKWKLSKVCQKHCPTNIRDRAERKSKRKRQEHLYWWQLTSGGVQMTGSSDGHHPHRHWLFSDHVTSTGHCPCHCHHTIHQPLKQNWLLPQTTTQANQIVLWHVQSMLHWDYDPFWSWSNDCMMYNQLLWETTDHDVTIEQLIMIHSTIE